jgi:hypothetical protein
MAALWNSIGARRFATPIDARRRQGPPPRSGAQMISCLVDYRIDRSRQPQFEEFCRRWLDLTPKFGGVHHGYFLPGDGASDRALALFSVDNMAAYERFKTLAATNEEAIAANRLRDTEAGVIRWDRTFFRPLLPATALDSSPDSR